MMNLLFIVLDTLIRSAVVVGIYLGGRYLYRQARQGFPSFNDSHHTYADAQVHDYVVVGKWNGYRRDGSGSGFFHEACANAYLAEMVGDDPLFEVYATEKNVKHHCQWCEDMPCELCDS
jgi:hypothetical protein